MNATGSPEAHDIPQVVEESAASARLNRPGFAGGSQRQDHPEVGDILSWLRNQLDTPKADFCEC